MRVYFDTLSHILNVVQSELVKYERREESLYVYIYVFAHFDGERDFVSNPYL